MIGRSGEGHESRAVMQRLVYILTATAATLLLQLATGLLGPAGMVFTILSPLPAAFACMRQGVGVGGSVVVLTAAALAAVSGWAGSLTFLLQFGLGSLVLPLLLRRGRSWDRAVATTLVVVLGTTFIALAGYLAHSGQPVAGTVDRYVQSEIKRALEVYSTADLPDSERAELAAMAERTAAVLTRIYPGVAVAMSGAILLLTVLLLGALSRGRYSIPGPPFQLWKAPEPLIWLLIAGGFGSLLGEGRVESVAWNLLAVSLPLYFLQGLAVVSYFFRLRRFSPFMRGMGYLLVAVFNPFQLLVAGIGVFDLWVDFRKPRIRKT